MRCAVYSLTTEEPITFRSRHVIKVAETFPDWKPRASAHRLFDEAVARAEVAIKARTDALCWEYAIRSK
jgi:hypothetical protein